MLNALHAASLLLLVHKLAVDPAQIQHVVYDCMVQQPFTAKFTQQAKKLVDCIFAKDRLTEHLGCFQGTQLKPGPDLAVYTKTRPSSVLQHRL